MKPTKLWYLYLTCCAVLALTLSWRLSRIAHNYPEPFTPKIHSIRETQQELCDAGFDIEVDGIWGKQTERAYCDYMACRLWPKEK